MGSVGSRIFIMAAAGVYIGFFRNVGECSYLASNLGLSSFLKLS